MPFLSCKSEWFLLGWPEFGDKMFFLDA